MGCYRWQVTIPKDGTPTQVGVEDVQVRGDGSIELEDGSVLIDPCEWSVAVKGESSHVTVREGRAYIEMLPTADVAVSAKSEKVNEYHFTIEVIGKATYLVSFLSEDLVVTRMC